MSGTALPLLGALAMLLDGGHMVARPGAYIGRGTLQPADTRTLRLLGGMLALLGAAILAFVLVQFIPE